MDNNQSNLDIFVTNTAESLTRWFSLVFWGILVAGAGYLYFNWADFSANEVIAYCTAVIVGVPLAWSYLIGPLLIDLVLKVKFSSLTEDELKDFAQAIREQHQIGDGENPSPEQMLSKTWNEVTFTVEAVPDQPFTKFMDEFAYDWLDLKDSDGKVDRWFFKHVIQNKWDADLRPGQIIFNTYFVYEKASRV